MPICLPDQGYQRFEQNSGMTTQTAIFVNMKKTETKITRSSITTERPARLSVLNEMLIYCCINNANKSPVSLSNTFNKSPVSLSNTFNNCHVLVRYLHSFVHVSFNYRTASTGCRGCHQQTSIPVYNRPR